MGPWSLRRDAHGSGPHGEGTPWGDGPPRRRPVSVAAAIHTEAYVNSGDKKPRDKKPGVERQPAHGNGARIVSARRRPAMQSTNVRE